MNKSGPGDICALKMIPLKHSIEDSQPKFENEIRTMRRVSNRHIASFYAAYIFEKKNHVPRFCILMQPAANSGTLESFISACRAGAQGMTREQLEVLLKTFGCLSTALKFIHRHMIRHKDVKPANILLHDGKVLLADFGSSWDGVAIGTLTTHDPEPKGHTDRFAAPEVKTHDQRNAKSDVFALGAVFYEVLCAIDGRATWYDEDYHRSIRTIRPALAKWTNPHGELAVLIGQMLNSDKDKRPTAREVVAILSARYFCDPCLQEYQDEPASSSSQQQYAFSSERRASAQRGGRGNDEEEEEEESD